MHAGVYEKGHSHREILYIGRGNASFAMVGSKKCDA